VAAGNTSRRRDSRRACLAGYASAAVTRVGDRSRPVLQIHLHATTLVRFGQSDLDLTNKTVVTTTPSRSSKTARIVGWVLVAVQTVFLAAVFPTPGSSRWTAGPAVKLASQALRAVGFLPVAISAIELGCAFTAHPSPKRNATPRLC
jgi:hypothetical protein